MVVTMDGLIEGGSMPLDEFRVKAAALKALARPIARERSPRYDYGDGDPCPIDRAHGRMYVNGKTQYCPHHSHDGLGKREATRKFWPLYGPVLPDIDASALED